MTKWQEVRLGDVCDVKGGKRLPKGVNLVTIKNTHPYIRVRDLGQGKRLQLNQNYEYVDDETQKIISHYIVSEDDVLISIVGTIGLIGIVGNSLNNANLTENCVKLINLRGIDKDFLYYFLISNSGQDAIKQGTVGAVQAKLPIKNIQTIQILLPPLDVQKKIAGVLGALDDKIELNNRINNNLEQQAQALFKSWFVDFEPFGGTMPDDWKEINLSDIAIFVGGYSYKGSELQISSTAMATIKNFGRQGGFKLDGFKEILPSSKLKETQKADLFDILVAHTDLTQNADVIGNAEMLLSKAGYLDVIISMDVVKVMPQKGISKFLLAALLKDNRFKQHCLGYINGTTVLHLSKKALPEFTFAFPNSVDTVNELTQTLECLYKKLASNIAENTRLVQLRDILLPKLMSGEIDVDKVSLRGME